MDAHITSTHQLYCTSDHSLGYALPLLDKGLLKLLQDSWLEIPCVDSTSQFIPEMLNRIQIGKRRPIHDANIVLL